MKIIISGATGFVGRHLCRALSDRGHEITVLARSAINRNIFDDSVGILEGDPTRQGDWQLSFAEYDAVINLAGTSIFQRWTKRIQKEILQSRVLSTRNIVDALKDTGRKDIILLNASGVGYYGHCGDETIDENSPAGNTYLASVAESWESEARRAEDAGIRVIRCRFGIVLGKNGGAFPRMFPLFRYRLGAMWGTGRQWFSWIHENDVAGIVSFLLENHEIRGPVNFTAPVPVTNEHMTETLNMLLGAKPFVGRFPEWFFRSILGEFADVFLKGQRVIPQVLLKNGYAFHFATLEEAVAVLISSPAPSSSQRRPSFY